MMKKIVLLLSCLFFIPVYSQEFEEYFAGEFIYCESADPTVENKFVKARALLTLIQPSDTISVRKLSYIFHSQYRADSTFCDAAFFTGYTFQLLGQYKESMVYYYMADSLSHNKSLLFKVNLAKISLEAGVVDFSRKKFEETVKHFPTSPEGYFGIALTASIIGDYKNGIAAVNDAIRWCNRRKIKDLDEAYFLKGMLYTFDGRYAEGRELLGMAEAYKEDDMYYAYYSLNLLWDSQAAEDEKLKKEAKRYYKKIKHKSSIPAHIKQEFGAFNKTED